MYSIAEINSIHNEFVDAFNSSREYLFKNSHKFIRKRKGKRQGDWYLDKDKEVFGFYEKIAKKHKMLMLCEEDWAQLENEKINGFKYLLILDSIDGSINMLSNLPFGVNIAFGPIVNNSRDFCIKDIKSVFIANYLTSQQYHWVEGSQIGIEPPNFDGQYFNKSTQEQPLVFEIPDEKSYISIVEASENIDQYELLEIFRSVFSECQRRAIDCTGLRMLEICKSNIIAYGDLRGATRIWDTIPSIKFLMEYDSTLRLLENERDLYSGETIILINNKNGKFEINKQAGSRIIILRNSDLIKFDSCLKIIKKRKEKLKIKDSENLQPIIYDFNGSSPKFYINSTDYNINIESLHIVYENIENAITEGLQDSDQKSKILSKLNEMKFERDKKQLRLRYNEFIQSAANHMTLVAPFIPALTNFII